MIIFHHLYFITCGITLLYSQFSIEIQTDLNSKTEHTRRADWPLEQADRLPDPVGVGRDVGVDPRYPRLAAAHAPAHQAG